MLFSKLAEQVGSVLEGRDAECFGAAPLETAAPNELAFVGNLKAAASASLSRAGCLLVPDEFPPGRTVIRVPDPRASFARIIRILYPETRPTPGVHPTAVVSPDAAVGQGVFIGPHVTVGEGAIIGAGTAIFEGCSIGARVRIGANSTLYPNVTLYRNVIVGDRVVLHSGCILGADGFGFVMAGDRYEKFPQIGTVEIGDDVEIGANACVDRAALGVTRIRSGAKLDNMVHVGHNCDIGCHVVVAAQTGFSGGVVVEDYAIIGGQVGIGDKARIESRAVLGSGCGVLTSKIVRKGQVVWGTPARPLKDYLEQLANMARLPRLRAQVAVLRKDIDELKSRGLSNPR